MKGRVAAGIGIVALAAVVGAGAPTRPGAAPGGGGRWVAPRPVGRVQLVGPGLDGGAGAPAQISAADVSGLVGRAGSPPGDVTVTGLPGVGAGAGRAPEPVTVSLAPSA